MLTLWAQAQAWGLSHAAFRAFDLVTHLACGSLFCLLLLRNGAQAGVAHAVTAVFLVHPSATEAVMWVTGGRNDLLGTLFALAALLCVSARTPWWGVAGATVFVAAAVLCKESFVVLPVILAAYIVIRRGHDRSARTWIDASLPILGVALVWLVRRSLHLPAGPVLGTPFGERLVAYASALWHYAAQIAVLDNGATAERFTPLSWWSAAVALSSTFIAGVLLRSLRLAAFGWLWFVVALAPYAVTLPILGQWGNRYAYFACLGIATAVAFLVPELAKRVPRLSGLAATSGVSIVVVLLSLRTSQEASLWHDGVTLFGADVARSPEDSRAHYHYGVELLTERGCEGALPHFVLSAQFEPTYARAFHDVAGCLIRLGRPVEALEAARRNVALEPWSPGVLYNFAVALFASGDRARSIEYLTRALDRDPGYRPARSLLDEIRTRERE
jgi:tetratricopeptide (TPR) repeat protein